MKTSLKTGLLSLTLILSAAPTAYAMGSKAPAPTPAPAPGGGDALVDLALNLAIGYAKSDPRYSVVLGALGINTAQDLRNFIGGNASGGNFQNILAHLIWQRAQSDSKTKTMLSSLGIKDEIGVRNFLANPSGGLDFQNLLSIGLQQAVGNSKYATWLQTLNIKDVQDLQNLLKGSGSGGNLMSLVLVIGMEYAQSNPKLAQYVPIIQAAMASFGVSPGSDGSNGGGSDDDIIGLGAFSGMTVGETKAVQAVTKK